MAKQGGIKDIALGRSDIFIVDPRHIRVKAEWNCREMSGPDFEAGIDELAASIAEIGVKEPLTVYWEGGEPVLSDGHRRLMATMRAIERGAEIKGIPVKTEGRYASEADRVFSQIVRNAGVPLTPFERGKVFKRLIDLGWSEAEIATKSGLSRTYVVSLLELQTAPEQVKQMVRDGEVSASLAMTVHRASKGDGAQASAALSEAVQAAHAAGKTRATPKHVKTAPGAPPLKERVLRLLNEHAQLYVDSEADSHSLVFCSFYRDLCELVGQPLPVAEAA